MEVNRSTMCDLCPEAEVCVPHMENARRRVALAKNKIDARPGDLVELTIADGVILWGAFVIYLIPVFFLLIFVIGAHYLNLRLGWDKPEMLLSGIASGLGLAVSLVVVRLLSTRWKYLATGRPEINRILSPDNNEK